MPNERIFFVVMSKYPDDLGKKYFRASEGRYELRSDIFRAKRYSTSYNAELVAARMEKKHGRKFTVLPMLETRAIVSK
jgi:hypothetical protein